MTTPADNHAAIEAAENLRQAADARLTQAILAYFRAQKSQEVKLGHKASQETKKAAWDLLEAQHAPIIQAIRAEVRKAENDILALRSQP
jgi:hypothetical protein